MQRRSISIQAGSSEELLEARTEKSTITVVPGFRALGPSTALGALNPGSALNRGNTLINKLEIVNSQLMVDLKNPTFFQRPPKN